MVVRLAAVWNADTVLTRAIIPAICGGAIRGIGTTGVYGVCFADALGVLDFDMEILVTVDDIA